MSKEYGWGLLIIVISYNIILILNVSCLMVDTAELSPSPKVQYLGAEEAAAASQPASQQASAV